MKPSLFLGGTQDGVVRMLNPMSNHRIYKVPVAVANTSFANPEDMPQFETVQFEIEVYLQVKVCMFGKMINCYIVSSEEGMQDFYAARHLMSDLAKSLIL